MKKIALIFAMLLASIVDFANQCDVEQIRGTYGVRERRASGWVFITTNQTAEEAYNTLEQLKAGGRCD